MPYVRTFLLKIKTTSLVFDAIERLSFLGEEERNEKLVGAAEVVFGQVVEFNRADISQPPVAHNAPCWTEHGQAVAFLDCSWSAHNDGIAIE